MLKLTLDTSFGTLTSPSGSTRYSLVSGRCAFVSTSVSIFDDRADFLYGAQSPYNPDAKHNAIDLPESVAFDTSDIAHLATTRSALSTISSVPNG